MINDLTTQGLELATDAQLFNELVRRSRAGDRRAFVFAHAKPDQDLHGDDLATLCVTGTDPLRLQWLIAVLCQRLGLRGCPDGRIEIPRIDPTITEHDFLPED